MAGAISAADTFSVNEVKDTSVEELHNLAGASDIKVPLILSPLSIYAFL